MPFSRGSSWPRDQTHVSCVSCIGGQVLYHWQLWEVQWWIWVKSKWIFILVFFHFLIEFQRFKIWSWREKKVQLRDASDNQTLERHCQFEGAVVAQWRHAEEKNTSFVLFCLEHEFYFLFIYFFRTWVLKYILLMWSDGYLFSRKRGFCSYIVGHERTCRSKDGEIKGAWLRNWEEGQISSEKGSS